MKHLSMTVAAVALTALMAFLLPSQVVSAADDGKLYISEVKIGMAKEEKDAKAALEDEGYTVLDCNLNQDADDGEMSKGKKATYLGYKTTDDPKEGITDLALMNMNGGYETKDYELMKDKYISGEIVPLVESFISAVKEYRINYSSKLKANQTRAKAVHDLLNKFTGDDTGGRMGDLLLNETKYELGDEAYNKLSDSEKKKHADIVTILAQANGQAMLVIEELITRASDTNKDSWLDRFSKTTYDDLAVSTGKAPSDAKSTLANKYGAAAETIVNNMWNDFKHELEGYDDALDNVNNYDGSSYEAAVKAFNNMDENTSEDEKEEITSSYIAEVNKYCGYVQDLELVTVYEMLRQTGYKDGTPLDFFLQDTRSDDFDLTCVYPLAASLTEGQRSGLGFVSLREFCAMGVTGEDGYSKIDTGSIPETSVYNDIDRDIYAPGGVAVLSGSIGTQAESNIGNCGRTKISGTTLALCGVTGAFAVAFAESAAKWVSYSSTISSRLNAVTTPFNGKSSELVSGLKDGTIISGSDRQSKYLSGLDRLSQTQSSVYGSTTLCKNLKTGESAAAIIMADTSISCTFRDLHNYYRADLTPQPRYIVGEWDVTGYNKKGEKIVVRDQTAYYKIVETNRPEDAEYYRTLGTGNDLNGDVGQQWLTLYSVKKEAADPILAGTLRAVVGSADIPAGYETGIHMFGEDTAYNLNDTELVWNENAPSIKVYYKTDSTAPSESGSSFSAGVVALAAGTGLLAGALLTAASMIIVKKRRVKEKL